MEELLKYFMAKTDQRFDQIEEKIDDLHTFKIETIVSARWVSLLVSSFCGLLTMLATLWASGAFTQLTNWISKSG